MFYTVAISTAADLEFWIRLVTSKNTRIQVVLDQEDYPQLDGECLTADERLPCFSKSGEKIIGKVKGAESSSFEGPQYSEEYLCVRNRVPIRIERLSVR